MNPASVSPASSVRYVGHLSDTARWLGHLGLAPFLLGALLIWVSVWAGLAPDLHEFVTKSLSAYSGLIVSFLGGIHWGLALRMTAPPPTLFIWGVVPSMVAWLAVMMPPYAGLVLHGVMLLVCYAVDRRIYPVQGAAQWLTLRFRLSTVASFCCFLGAAGT